jgi:1-acyl-sn-glycerol-3-phosphate acyltransferase
MRWVLAALRFAGFVALTAACGVALALGGERARAPLFRFWARALLTLIGVEVEVEGRPPAPGAALFANHLSYLDVAVLGSLVDARFVAKADVASWPGLGPLAARAGTIFIDRGRKRDLLRVLPLVEGRLRAGETVVFFPEGTSSGGASVLPFRSPLFAAPLRAARPVACASLRYETRPGDPPASAAVCWWGDMPFLSHLFALLSLSGVRATVSFPAETLWEDDRKRLATRARAAIQKHGRFAPEGNSR